MTEQTPMTTKDMPGAAQQQGQPQGHRVKVAGGREITLAEARAAMDPALAQQLAQQYPRADETPELAQQLVDAYAAQHEAQRGEKWTGTGRP